MNYTLHPDLLSNETLYKILVERRVKVNGLEKMERNILLKLFQQYCLPHEQRKKRCDRNKNIESQTERDYINNLSMNNQNPVKNTHELYDRFEPENKRFKQDYRNSFKIEHSDKRKSSEFINEHSIKVFKSIITWP